MRTARSGSRRIPERARGNEMMDHPEIDGALLDRSLRELGRVNRWLGGLRSLSRGIHAVANPGETLSILDVGTGDAGLPRALARRMERRRMRLEWVGLEPHPGALTAARRAGPGRLVKGDGRSLPFRDSSFDVVSAVLTLHHMEDRDCARLLREMGRVCRRAILVSDLERHPLHHLGARLLSATLWRGDPVTRHDGPLSVLRGFTRSELLELAAQAGLRKARVRRFAPFRLLLLARPGRHEEGGA